MHHPEFRGALPQHRPVRRPVSRVLAAGLLTLLTAATGPQRTLLVFAPSDTDPNLAAQRAALHPDSAGSAERDLAVVEVVGDRASEGDGAALRARWQVRPELFAVVLIGKDGGEKRRWSRPVSEAALFATIDRMPMRRDEAARQKGQP